jgi:signal transduction histidine kinase/CheY-like chemotaxis protein
LKHTGLRAQVLLAVMLATLVVVLASVATAAWFFVDRQAAAQRSRSLAIADALSNELERILALDIPLHDLQGFDAQCDEAMARHAGLSFALVVDRNGQTLFRSARQHAPAPALPPLSPALAVASPPAALRSASGDSELVLSAVQAPGGDVVAAVVVGFPHAALVAERNALLLRMGAAGALALLLVLGLLYGTLSRVLIRPLGHVVDAVSRQRGGDREASVLLPRPHSDELQLLADGFNGLVQTVAERERELVAARDAAEQASRAKSHFLAIMSHELRTPLNAVLGMADLLQRTPLDARQARLLGHVRSSGRLLAAIITDLLDLSTIEAGRLRVAALPYRLHDTLHEAVERFRPEAERRGLVLSVDFDPALPEKLVGDALRTQQVLGNLLANALKFTERGGVRVTVSPMVGAVRVAVADSGIGIDEEFLPHVYEAFRQADGAVSRRFGGTGLGLSIARALCDAMGGRIDVATRPGRGTTFWFELPLRLPDPDAETHFGELSAPDGPPPDTTGPDAAQRPAMRRRDLLLVEDNAANRDYLVALLHAAGHRVVTAGDGTEGLSRLYDRRWDAVLLDWQLPGIDGLGLLRALRGLAQREGWPPTPVVIVTAYASPAHRQTCLDAGVDAYLAKPFSAHELESVLQRVLDAADDRAQAPGPGPTPGEGAVSR